VTSVGGSGSGSGSGSVGVSDGACVGDFSY